jgi:hypothetical protein
MQSESNAGRRFIRPTATPLRELPAMKEITPVEFNRPVDELQIVGKKFG